MKLSRVLTYICLCLSGLGCGAVTAFAQDWKPVTPEELAQKTPLIDKDADAEAIFWEVRINTDDANEGGFVRQNYIRIKIFTLRGRELYSRVKIEHSKNSDGQSDIRQVAARTIKPDGTIIEVKSSDILETTEAKTKRVKLTATAFAMPGIEPGAIIEYRWRTVFPNQYFRLFSVDFQRELPIQKITCYVTPNSRRVSPEYSQLRYWPFQMPDGFKFEPDKKKPGSYVATLSNAPAFRQEPRMPPEASVRARVVIFYSKQSKNDPAAYWRDAGRELYDKTKDLTAVNADVQKAAQEALGDATDTDEKLRRLYVYCQTKIKDLFDDASGLTPEQRTAFKKNKSPSDTLKQGIGTGLDIDQLFVALAKAAGFDARMTRTSSRDQIFFDMNFADDQYLSGYNTAVKVGDEWRFFDPAGRHLQFGMLRWQEEGVPVLIADKNEMLFAPTPISSPDRSKIARFANLTLTEEGTLNGTVRIAYTGHWAASRKEAFDEETDKEREDALRNEIKARLSTAEVSDIKIENITDSSKPLVYTYTISVSGYAQRTGKRLFFQPAFFQANNTALFSGSTRANEIYFAYPWAEDDQITIKLPAGYEMESPEAPTSLGAGAISQYKVLLSRTKDNGTVVLRRTFFFGAGVKNYLTFPPTAYGMVKQYFDEINKQDTHTLTLKQSAPPPAQP